MYKYIGWQIYSVRNTDGPPTVKSNANKMEISKVISFKRSQVSVEMTYGLQVFFLHTKVCQVFSKTP